MVIVLGAIGWSKFSHALLPNFPDRHPLVEGPIVHSSVNHFTLAAHCPGSDGPKWPRLIERAIRFVCVCVVIRPVVSSGDRNCDFAVGKTERPWRYDTLRFISSLSWKRFSQIHQHRFVGGNPITSN